MMSYFDAIMTAEPTDETEIDPVDATPPNPKSPIGRWAIDPLDPDEPEDEILVTSSRRMLRVALAAADAGWRFATEGRLEDPAAWMLTPRTMFAGAPPIEACQDLVNFERSVVLHGIGAGLDADPEMLDALRGPEDRSTSELTTDDRPNCGNDTETGIDPMSIRLERPTLLTCWIDDGASPLRTVGLCGMVTDRPVELVDLILSRFGAEAAENAEFVVGYEGTSPLAAAVVSETLALALEHAAECPTSELARGLQVAVGWRVAA